MEVSAGFMLPAAVSSGDNPGYPLHTRLGVPRSWSGCRGEWERYLPLAEISVVVPWSSAPWPGHYT